MEEMVYIFIEFGFSISLFVNAMLFVPQIIQLWRTKSADNLSLTMFAGFNLIQLFTILHAYLHGDTLLFIGMGLAFLTCGMVSLLILYDRLFRITKKF